MTGLGEQRAGSFMDHNLPTRPCAQCVTLGKPLPLSEPQKSSASGRAETRDVKSSVGAILVGGRGVPSCTPAFRGGPLIHSSNLRGVGLGRHEVTHYVLQMSDRSRGGHLGSAKPIRLSTEI